MSKTLIYISDFGGESQVLNLLKAVEASAFFDNIFLLVHEKDEAVWQRLIKAKKGFSFEILRYSKYPNYHFFNSLQLKAIRKVLKNLLTDNTVFHLRGAAFSAIIKKIIKKSKCQNVKILTDVRGASYEEIELYSSIKQPFLKLKLFHINRTLQSLKMNSDYISCVSSSLKKYVIGKSDFDADKIFINHCIAGDKFKYSKQIREEYRRKLDLNTNDVLFLFVTGGNAPWQNTSKIINKIASRGYKILNLSRREIQHENVINLFVPYSEVSNYLNAADISIVWRNNDIVNNVAAPIKFSEYVSTGLPVVATNGVHLISNYIEKTGFGKIVNDIDELDSKTINKLISLDRTEISLKALEIFSLDVISKQYMNIYINILKS